MRIETIHVKTRKAAINQMPWASWIVKVVEGYRGFESYDDYKLFLDYKSQKRHLVK